MDNIEKPAKKQNYVDNEKMYNAFVDWYAQIEKAKEEGKKEPQPPRYISESIMAIATNIASRYNFYRYTFRDDMVGDAIEDCVRGLRKFDIVKYKSPFAYFTRICYFAMVRKILKERDQQYVKHCLIKNSSFMDNVEMQVQDDSEFASEFIETLKTNLNPALEEYYTKKHKKTQKQKPVDDKITIEDFLVDGDLPDEILEEIVDE